MKEITIEMIDHLINNIQIPLAPTQPTLCIPIINRIYLKMVNDLKFDDIKICGDLIIDGHHRYVSSLLAQKDIGNVPTHKTSATKEFTWQSVKFVDIEWDTEEKIEKLNREDAEFNNIPISRIYEMTR